MGEVEAIQQWKKSAFEDLETAQQLFDSQKYSYSLFFLHLALEKILKGLHQHLKHEPAIPIHKLSRLAEMCGLELDRTIQAQLDEITTFNISARYDDYKREFYKKATKEYSTKWLVIGRKLFYKFSKELS